MLLSLGLSITIFLITALLTWAWTKIAQIKNIHDQPERRRLHQALTPRAGGISIALAMIFSCLLIFQSGLYISPYGPLVFTALILYAILGFVDDVKPVRPQVKLLIHVLIAGVILLLALYLIGSSLMAATFLAVAYLLYVNTWNFMDGSNGLVGIQSLLIVAGILALSHLSNASYWYALALAASCLGFLPFNFPVPRVFLGDVGSHVLGAAIIGLALLAYDESGWTLLEILCLTSALLIDASLTLIRRAFRGFKVTQAHRSHLYQYAIRRGRSHASICMYYAAWTVFTVLLIASSRRLPETGHRILLLAVIILGCVLHQYLRLRVLKYGYHPKRPKPAP